MASFFRRIATIAGKNFNIHKNQGSSTVRSAGHAKQREQVSREIPESLTQLLDEHRTFLRLRGFPHMGQNSFEIDITYLMLANVLIVLGAGVFSVDSFLGF
jgi:hypothetical protein